MHLLRNRDAILYQGCTLQVIRRAGKLTIILALRCFGAYYKSFKTWSCLRVDSLTVSD